MSSAEIAIMTTPPRPAVIASRQRPCQIASTSVASRPTANGATNSSRQAPMVRSSGRCSG
jgi:hypothetical protein